MGTFVGRVQELRDVVGSGHIEASVTVDQRYAAYQHFLTELVHPDGGKANYLRDPFYAGFQDYLRDYAGRFLDDGGRGGPDSLMDSMEHLSRGVFDQAPWEFADLRASGHPHVEQGGKTLHDRPPNIARLSDDELREKARLRNLFDPDRYGYDRAREAQ